MYFIDISDVFRFYVSQYEIVCMIPRNDEKNVRWNRRLFVWGWNETIFICIRWVSVPIRIQDISWFTLNIYIYIYYTWKWYLIQIGRRLSRGGHGSNLSNREISSFYHCRTLGFDSSLSSSFCFAFLGELFYVRRDILLLLFPFYSPFSD